MLGAQGFSHLNVHKNPLGSSIAIPYGLQVQVGTGTLHSPLGPGNASATGHHSEKEDFHSGRPFYLESPGSC